MSVFRTLYEYIKDLEDEVMTLRAKFQAMTNERDMWKKWAYQLALGKGFEGKPL